MSEHTNISTRPVGTLDGVPVKPCMKSGFCCSTAPCAYGEKREDGPGCKFLSDANELGQRGCDRYDWIVANVPDWKMYPAFGGGCCMPLGNTKRIEIIATVRANGLDEYFEELKTINNG